ncbi:MAG: oligosaccharide flippase family protein [Spirochaetes bacterium]|nr:oligosaccharide flippase family protein [Spirochaetota bacterium]
MNPYLRGALDFSGRVAKDRFFRNTVLLTGFTLLGSLANYVWQVFANRNLDPAQYGLLNALLASTALFSIFGEVFSQWALKGYTELAAHQRASGLGGLTRFFSLRIGLLATLFIIIAAVGTLLNPGFFKLTSLQEVPLFAAMLLLYFASILPAAFLDGHQRYYLNAIGGFLGAGVRLGFLALFLYSGLSITKALSSHLLSILTVFLFITLASLLVARRLPGREEAPGAPPKAQELFYFFRIGLSSIFLTLILNQDMLLARYRLDPASSGQWATLSVFGKAVFFAATAALSILFVSVADRFHKRLPYGRAFLKSLAGVGGIALLGTMGLAIFIQPFLAFLNPAYRSLVPEVMIFAVTTLPFIFIKFFAVFYVSVNRFRVFLPMLALALVQAGLYSALGTTLHRFLWIRGISGFLILAAMAGYFAWKRGKFYPTDGDAEH